VRFTQKIVKCHIATAHLAGDSRSDVTGRRDVVSPIHAIQFRARASRVLHIHVVGDEIQSGPAIPSCTAFHRQGIVIKCRAAQRAKTVSAASWCDSKGITLEERVVDGRTILHGRVVVNEFASGKRATFHICSYHIVLESHVRERVISIACAQVTVFKHGVAES
jgi:hypothetical protein